MKEPNAGASNSRSLTTMCAMTARRRLKSETEAVLPATTSDFNIGTGTEHRTDTPREVSFSAGSRQVSRM
jgi:hypothetical protein